LSFSRYLNNWVFSTYHFYYIVYLMLFRLQLVWQEMETDVLTRETQPSPWEQGGYREFWKLGCSRKFNASKPCPTISHHLLTRVSSSSECLHLRRWSGWEEIWKNGLAVRGALGHQLEALS